MNLRNLDRHDVSRRRLRLIALMVVLAPIVGGCTFASAPIKDTPQIVATPQAGELTVSSQPAPLIGDVQPVYISVANGTDSPRAIVPSQIFALDNSGDRVAPLPPGEAARQAGGAGELKAALANAAVSGVGEGLVGAGVGALAGAFSHSAGYWGALGGALGAGTGIFSGLSGGQAKADAQANQQLSALALQGSDVRRNFTVSGYVFFPKGDYRQIQMLLVDGETGDTQVIDRPWK
ncbi:MAG TPA: hypothetical protein VJ718_04180 [Candidatus Binataceae bacterium]|nr:hypothetical protein [Candidatus Binataceae bacterium]